MNQYQIIKTKKIVANSYDTETTVITLDFGDYEYRISYSPDEEYLSVEYVEIIAACEAENIEICECLGLPVADMRSVMRVVAELIGDDKDS